MKSNIREINYGIFLKQNRVRHLKIYEYAFSRQINAILENDYITYSTFSKIKIALNTYCGLSPSEYDYLTSLKHPSLWQKEGD